MSLKKQRDQNIVFEHTTSSSDYLICSHCQKALDPIHPDILIQFIKLPGGDDRILMRCLHRESCMEVLKTEHADFVNQLVKIPKRHLHGKEANDVATFIEEYHPVVLEMAKKYKEYGAFGRVFWISSKGSLPSYCLSIPLHTMLKIDKQFVPFEQFHGLVTRFTRFKVTIRNLQLDKGFNSADAIKKITSRLNGLSEKDVSANITAASFVTKREENEIQCLIFLWMEMPEEECKSKLYEQFMRDPSITFHHLRHAHKSQEALAWTVAFNSQLKRFVDDVETIERVLSNADTIMQCITEHDMSVHMTEIIEYRDNLLYHVNVQDSDEKGLTFIWSKKDKQLKCYEIEGFDCVPLVLDSMSEELLEQEQHTAKIRLSSRQRDIKVIWQHQNEATSQVSSSASSVSSSSSKYTKSKSRK